METLDFSPKKYSSIGQAGLPIPLALQSVSQLQKRSSSQDELEHYKKNMKTFIAKVQQQVVMLIKKHSDQVNRLNARIKLLQKQNSHLKGEKANTMQNPQTYTKTYKQDSPTKTQRIGLQKNGEPWSPISKKRNNSITLIPTTSEMFQQNCNPQANDMHMKISSIQKKSEKFSLDLNFNSLKSCNRPSQQFPMQILDAQGNTPRNQINRKSRFESNSTKKKMRREQVIQYLQAGSKNLDENTNKMMILLGKIDPHQDEESQEIILEMPRKERDQELNSSLGQICDSLDNSFASKRSRAKKSVFKQAQAKEAQIKKARQIEQEKRKKQKGVKNVLKSIRQSIQFSPQKHQIVKASKLLTTGNLTRNVGKNSKVLINPVPVQTEGITRSQSIQSPKKSSGILKRNSILSKSIEGISAISIHQ